jgi:FkbM family methyltransferase
MNFESIINFIDIYHQNRIIKYIKKFKIDYFIDVGSHKGEFLSYLMKLNYKNIYCFEPQKKIFNILFKRFRKKKGIKLYNLALSDKNTFKNFYVSKFTLTSTLSKSKNSFYSRFKNFILNNTSSYSEKKKIRTKKLDEVIYKKKLDNIFLKIDVEGFELNVLKGAKKLLLNKIKFVLVENSFFNFMKITLLLK